MSKTLFTVHVEPETRRNRVVIAMGAQKLGQRAMKDRRTKRQNRRSWRKDHGV